MGHRAAFIAARAHQGAARALARGAPEFFGILPLTAVGLFALNNFVLKRTWPGWVTGKLSDLLVCFFLPLFVSALLEQVSRLGAATRVTVGIALTATIFIAVKTSVAASLVLDRDIAMLLQPFGLRSMPNRADVTDLCALPMLALAWLHARRTAFAGPRPSGEGAR
jgi:hypothetical protein